MNFHPLKYVALLLLAMALFSCSNLEFRGEIPAWVYADLIALDPTDTSDPGKDIIAVYSRYVDDEIQVRLDFLEQSDYVSFDLHLALDTIPGGSNHSPLNYGSELLWEDWIKIPASGDIQVLSNSEIHQKQWGMLVFRNPGRDSIVIKFDRIALLGPYRADWEKPGINLQAFTTEPDSKEVVDATSIANTNDTPPEPVNVLFAFNNTLPGYSPSQVLRKWDGAHTGPFGGRHGLFNLLRTARSNRIPLVLLDLKYPSTVAALDAIGELTTIRQMEDEGLLILPLPLPDTRYSPLEVDQGFMYTWIQKLENNSISHGLLPSLSLFNPESNLISLNGYPFFSQITADEEQSAPKFKKIQPSNNTKTIRLDTPPDSPSGQQVDLNGPTLDSRRLLISEAISNNLYPREGIDRIIVLGGDLPASAWGVPEISRVSFQYFAAHPWVKPVDYKTLESLIPEGNPRDVFEGHLYNLNGQNRSLSDRVEDALLMAVNHLPDNPLAKTAVDSYISFFYPIYPFNNNLVELRRNYIPHLWTLVEAAKWAEDPAENTNCRKDIDHDGSIECLLTSRNVFAVIEPDGGYLSFLFIRNSDQFHQIIGPSSQFTTGTTDPLFWDKSQGIHADPRVMVGAFEDHGIMFQVETNQNGIKLFSNSIDYAKSFNLIEKGLTVEYTGLNTDSTLSTSIPLALDLRRLFYYSGEKPLIYTNNKGFLDIKLDGNILLQVKTSADMQVDSTLDMIDFLKRTENPNFEYPPGFYLPYPFTLIKITGLHDFQTSISLLPN